jgi:ribosomal-protein-alanine N-acetyltransferase
VRAAVPRRVHTSAVALDYPDPPLDDGVVRLRPWSDGDLDTVVEASRDAYIPRVTTVPAPFTKGAGTRWIDRQRARRTSGTGLSLAIARSATGEAIGGLVIIHRGKGLHGLGYWVLRSARRQEVASRAVALVVAWALAQEGVKELEALVEPWNEASRRVAERAGFVAEPTARVETSVAGRRAEVIRYVLGGQSPRTVSKGPGQSR